MDVIDSIECYYFHTEGLLRPEHAGCFSETLFIYGCLGMNWLRRTLMLSTALISPQLAYGQCVPAAPAAVDMSSGACTDNNVTRENADDAAILITGGAYAGVDVTIKSAGNTNARGAVAIGLGSIDLTGGSVVTDGGDALVAEGGGRIDADSLQVKANGSASSGVLSTGAGSLIVITNSTIDSVADVGGALAALERGRIFGSMLELTSAGTIGESHTVLAVGAGSRIDLSDSLITSAAPFIGGLYAYKGSEIIGSGLRVHMTGRESDAVVSAAGPGGITITNSELLTEGEIGRGINAWSKSQIDASNVEVETQGEKAEAIFSSEAETRVTVSGSSVLTLGTASHGLRAQNGSAIIAHDVGVTTLGGSAVGAVASAASIELHGGSVTASGASAHGLSAQDGGQLTADSTAVSVSGVNAAAVHVTGGAIVSLNTLTVTGGSLSSSQGPLVLSEGGGGTISLNGPMTTTSGTFGGLPAFATILEGVAPSKLTLDLNGLGSVAGTFSVTGTGNLTNTTFDATDWVGDLVADVGNTPNTLLSGSRWTGQATNAADILLDHSSIWRITDDSNATGTITNVGQVQFAPLAGGFSTLTTHDYVGQGGSIGFNTFLGSDNSPTDLLVIDGGTASGTTKLAVTNAGGGGARTSHDGIRLVQAINGGTTDVDAFALARRIAAGAYEYRLFRGGAAGTEDWFLRSWLLPPDPDPKPDPAPDPGPGPAPEPEPGPGPTPTPDPGPGPIPDPDPIVPIYRPEAPLYAPIPVMARRMGLATIGTLHERVGEEMNQRGHSGSGKVANGAWARLIGERGNGSWAGSADARVREAHLVGMQAGLDIYRAEHDNDHRDHIGIYGAYTDYRSSSVSGFALGQQDLLVGELTLNGPAAGAYWTHFGPSGWYLDTVIQGNWFDVEATSFYDAQMSARGTGFAASLEGGYPIRFGEHWQLEPQAQIIYQTVSVNGSEDAYSTVSWNAGDSVAGRIGARLQYTVDDGATLWQPYVKANLWHDFRGTDQVIFGDTSALESRFGNTSAELGVGITARVDQGTSLYGHIDHRWSVDGEERHSATQAAIGLRLNW